MAPNQRQQRVKNTNPIFIDGIRWDSEAEAYYYTVLKKQVETREIRGFYRQETFELQPQFRKCERGCGFMWEKPSEFSPDYARYKKARECPQCGAPLFLTREMSYVADFVVANKDGSYSVIDVKSSPHFQTEIFKLKKRLFEYKFPDKILEMVFPKPPKGWGKSMRAMENGEHKEQNNPGPG